MQDMKEENILQLIISSENLPIIDPDLERQHFNSPSRGYHAHMNIWILLIEDESLICRKKKGNEYDFHAVVILEITMLDVCPKTKVIIFGNSYLCLRHQFAFGSQVKKSTVVQIMALKFLYALFFKAMSKEQHR